MPRTVRVKIEFKLGKTPSARDLDLLRRALVKQGCPKFVRSGNGIITVQDDRGQSFLVTIHNTLFFHEASQSYKVFDLKYSSKKTDKGLKKNPTYIAQGGFGKIYSSIGTLTLSPVPLYQPAQQSNPTFRCRIDSRTGEVLWQRDLGWVVKVPRAKQKFLKYFETEAEQIKKVTGMGAELVTVGKKKAERAEGLLMPKVGNTDLFTLSVDKKLTFDERILSIYLVLCEVKRLHASGFLHRDIKAENFVADTTDPRNLRVKMIDLLQVARLTSEGEVEIDPGVPENITTPEFLAPEFCPEICDPDQYLSLEELKSSLMAKCTRDKLAFLQKYRRADEFVLACLIADLIFGCTGFNIKRLKSKEKEIADADVGGAGAAAKEKEWEFCPANPYNFKFLEVRLGTLVSSRQLTRNQQQSIMRIVRGLGVMDPESRMSIDEALQIWRETFPKIVRRAENLLVRRSGIVLKIAEINLTQGDLSEESRLKELFNEKIIQSLSHSRAAALSYKIEEGENAVVVVTDETSYQVLVKIITESDDDSVEAVVSLRGKLRKDGDDIVEVSKPEELILDAQDLRVREDFEAAFPHDLLGAIDCSRAPTTTRFWALGTTISADHAMQVLQYCVEKKPKGGDVLIHEILDYRQVGYAFDFSGEQLQQIGKWAQANKTIAGILRDHKNTTFASLAPPQPDVSTVAVSAAPAAVAIDGFARASAHAPSAAQPTPSVAASVAAARRSSRRNERLTVLQRKIQRRNRSLSCYVAQHQDREVLVCGTKAEGVKNSPILEYNKNRMLVATCRAEEKLFKRLHAAILAANCDEFTISESTRQSLGDMQTKLVEAFESERGVKLQVLSDEKYRLLSEGNMNVLRHARTLQSGNANRRRRPF